jgi:hypothetical protein
MDRRFSNATSTLATAALKLCAVLANYWRTALYDQESSRAALYARPWPEVSRGCGSARNADPLRGVRSRNQYLAAHLSPRSLRRQVR